MGKRAIIRIDEDKCNGCGLCVPSCAEGAIRIIDGKARLVSERFCDGLGACLGECPQGALTIEERDADEFDIDAAMEHLAKSKTADHHESPSGCPGSQVRDFRNGNAGAPAAHGGHGSHGGGCPGSRMMVFDKATDAKTASEAPAESALRQWPVQLMLVPPTAPYFKNADLLVTADCVPFAMADFHSRYLAGKALVVGCPKLDDAGYYVEKLTQIVAANDLKSITILHMEVPCCSGLTRVVSEAVRRAGVSVPVKDVTISLQGEVL